MQSVLGRLSIDQRRIGAFEPKVENKEHLNDFGFANSGYWETVIKLFLNTTAKVILIMPFLMNSVGVVLFGIIVTLVGGLGCMKTSILVRINHPASHEQKGRLLQLWPAYEKGFPDENILDYHSIRVSVLLRRVRVYHRASSIHMSRLPRSCLSPTCSCTSTFLGWALPQ